MDKTPMDDWGLENRERKAGAGALWRGRLLYVIAIVAVLAAVARH
jgi:hypothetical protein